MYLRLNFIKTKLETYLAVECWFVLAAAPVKIINNQTQTIQTIPAKKKKQVFMFRGHPYIT